MELALYILAIVCIAQIIGFVLALKIVVGRLASVTVTQPQAKSFTQTAAPPKKTEWLGTAGVLSEAGK